MPFTQKQLDDIVNAAVDWHLKAGTFELIADECEAEYWAAAEAFWGSSPVAVEYAQSLDSLDIRVE